MKEFLMTLLGVSLLSGALGVLTPKGHQKYLRLLTGLCLLSVMAGALVNLSKDGLSQIAKGLPVQEEEMSKYDEIYNQTLMHADAACLEEILKKDLQTHYSLNAEDISVSVSLSMEGEHPVVEKTTVLLRGPAVTVDPHEIMDRVASLTDAPCIIVYE